jgi:ABC-type sugar transport system permease subunit
VRSWKTVLPFLLPFTSIFALFLLYPAIYSIYLSFLKATIYTDLTRIFADMRYCGLENYTRLLEDKQFYWSLIMTFYYAVLTIPAGISLSLVLAAILSNKLPGAQFFRAAFYLPNVLDLFVIAVVWTAIYAPTYGALDQILKFAGIEKLFEQGILADPWWAMPGIALMVVLKGSGFGMILYLAAIQNIPADVYEAADIDGASLWQQFTKITIPLVKPVTLLLVVTGILGSLMAFSEIYAMTGGRPFETLPKTLPFFGGTTQGTTMLSGYYLFNKFYVSQEYGYAAAVSVALLCISLPLSVISFFAFRTDGPGLVESVKGIYAKLRGRAAAAGAR